MSKTTTLPEPIVENVAYANINHSTIKASMDGIAMLIPTDPENRHFQAIERFVAAGGIIAPFAQDE
jgi:hypothetical protein